jgi:hypothetical protein
MLSEVNSPNFESMHIFDIDEWLEKQYNSIGGSHNLDKNRHEARPNTPKSEKDLYNAGVREANKKAKFTRYTQIY